MVAQPILFSLLSDMHATRANNAAMGSDYRRWIAKCK